MRQKLVASANKQRQRPHIRGQVAVSCRFTGNYRDGLNQISKKARQEQLIPRHEPRTVCESQKSVHQAETNWDIRVLLKLAEKLRPATRPHAFNVRVTPHLRAGMERHSVLHK